MLDYEQRYPNVILYINEKSNSTEAILYNPNTGRTHKSIVYDIPSDCHYPDFNDKRRFVTVLAYTPDEHFIIVDTTAKTYFLTKSELLSQCDYFTNIEIHNGNIEYLGEIKTDLPLSIDLTTLKHFTNVHSRLSKLANQNIGTYFIKPNGKVVLSDAPTEPNPSYLVLPGATIIGVGAFTNKQISGVSLPETLLELEADSFEQALFLDSIDIPTNVIKIGRSCFSECTRLKHVTLPINIRHIPNSAFGSCMSLTKIKLPERLETIATYAFNACSSLERLTLPDTLTEIGQSAFSDCSELREIVLPQSLKKIGTTAFSGCRSLQSINIPPNVELGINPFAFCPNLRDIYITHSHDSLIGAQLGAPAGARVHYI